MNGVVLRRFVVALLAVLPASCVSLLPDAGAPPKLYTLTPASDFPPTPSRVSSQILVDEPVSPASLDTERIALARSPTSVDYFAAADWTDRAPIMVQSLLVQSFENSGRLTAIGRESLSLRADYILRIELRHFEADYALRQTPSAFIQVGVKLVKMPDRVIVAQRTIETRVPARENQMPAIIDAFDAALHQVMQQIVDWTLDVVH